ncbi:matrixin family metalloprotease [Aquimarina sp. RZ0]|uniref:matrixin family metalloprotease n=1 Tax=Aquimarina sp. RZ0 TaxID=2607730 RepID=UPI0011F37930|nr:matrixin family metalloprotease [Aquimarina sp. RZ0]KAA1246881.1 hypothetical protein F0000_05330 [Aquimarina sp. RZ0]
MKLLKIIFFLSLFVSCAVEDDYVPYEVEHMFYEDLQKVIKVDIIYVQPTNKANKSSYNLDVKHFINDLNGSFFNRCSIGLELGDVKTMYNDELYDLRDDRNNENIVFMTETENDYNRDRINIYVIKRSHTVAIAGMGSNQRALITDEFLYNSTAPHEIGHALGLGHYPEEGNIMSEIRPHLRKKFTENQMAMMQEKITQIQSTSD